MNPDDRKIIQLVADIPIEFMSNGSKLMVNCPDEQAIIAWRTAINHEITVGDVKLARGILMEEDALGDDID